MAVKLNKPPEIDPVTGKKNKPKGVPVPAMKTPLRGMVPTRKPTGIPGFIGNASLNPAAAGTGVPPSAEELAGYHSDPNVRRTAAPGAVHDQRSRINRGVDPKLERYHGGVRYREGMAPGPDFTLTQQAILAGNPGAPRPQGGMNPYGTQLPTAIGGSSLPKGSSTNDAIMTREDAQKHGVPPGTRYRDAYWSQPVKGTGKTRSEIRAEQTASKGVSYGKGKTTSQVVKGATDKKTTTDRLEQKKKLLTDQTEAQRKHELDVAKAKGSSDKTAATDPVKISAEIREWMNQLVRAETPEEKAAIQAEIDALKRYRDSDAAGVAGDAVDPASQNANGVPGGVNKTPTPTPPPVTKDEGSAGYLQNLKDQITPMANWLSKLTAGTPLQNVGAVGLSPLPINPLDGPPSSLSPPSVPPPGPSGANPALQASRFGVSPPPPVTESEGSAGFWQNYRDIDPVSRLLSSVFSPGPQGVAVPPAGPQPVPPPGPQGVAGPPAGQQIFLTKQGVTVKLKNPEKLQQYLDLGWEKAQ